MAYSVPRFWKGKTPKLISEEIPALPLESLRPVDAVTTSDPDDQAKIFEETLHQLKECLKGAKKTAILARSQSLEAERRQALCKQATEKYRDALGLRNKLRSLTVRMNLEVRRRVRALEGAPEWRQIRHAIQRSAELNRVSVSFAA